MVLPKIIFTDIDGVWTDGGMYYDENGNEWKKFNTSDSWGIAICREFAIKVVIVTGEQSKSVERRAAKLKVDHCFVGVKNKRATIDNYLQECGILWSEVAYIGDDINDFVVLQKAGYSACPISAPDYIKEIVDFVGKKRGGEGSFREFVESIILNNFSVGEMLERLKGK